MCVLSGVVPVPWTVITKGVYYRYAVYTEKTEGDSADIKPLEDLNSDRFDHRFLVVSPVQECSK